MRTVEQRRWDYDGKIKIYEENRVIHTISFQSKRKLKEILNDYRGLQISVMFHEQKGITDNERWWNNIIKRN